MKLKVLYDTSCFQSPQLSGVGIYAKKLCQQMAQSHDIEMAGLWRLSRWRKRAYIQSHFPYKNGPYLPGLGRQNFQGHTVHHGPDFRIFPIKGAKKVVTIHDMAVYEQGLTSESAIKRGIELIEQTLLRHRPDAIIAVSEFTKKSILHYYPSFEDKVHVIYHGADHLLKEGQNEGAKNNNEDKGNDYFLFVGNLETRKNLSRILMAFDLFYRPGLPKLQIVGRPGFGYDCIMQTFREMKNKDAVIWHGHVSQKQLQNIYQGAYAFLYPSLYEGFGIPILEAMSFGLPVITSEGSATQEVAGQAALFVQKDSPESIAKGLEKITEDSQLKKTLTQKGPEQMKKFTWKKCGEQTEKLYRSLL